MEHKIHILYGTIIGIIIYLMCDINLYYVLLFWIGSWLIPDLDHLINFVIKRKSINPRLFLKVSYEQRNKWKKMSNIKKNQYKYSFLFLHSLEFLVILLILSFWKIDFFYLAFGIIFHDIFDVMDFYHRKENIFIKMSMIYTYFYNKNRKLLEWV